MIPTLAETRKQFPRLCSADLLHFLGHRFFWRRSPDGPLQLFGQYQTPEIRKLCDLDCPDEWAGVGRWALAWVERPFGAPDDQVPELLIILYLYSSDPSAFDEVVSCNSEAVFLAVLHFEAENAGRFYDASKSNYVSLL